MRTALFIIALAIHDVAVSLGLKEFSDSDQFYVMAILFVFVIMDCIQLFRRER